VRRTGTARAPRDTGRPPYPPSALLAHWLAVAMPCLLHLRNLRLFALLACGAAVAAPQQQDSTLRGQQQQTSSGSRSSSTSTTITTTTTKHAPRSSYSHCAASDANLALLRETLCQSIGPFPDYPDCKLPQNLTAVGDWPNQAVYMYNLLATMVAPTTCLNTTEAQTTVAMLNIVDPAKSPWWSTWVQFQVQYYDMPRKPYMRIESPATLGRKCWAFAYLQQVWRGGLHHSLEAATAQHNLSLKPFFAAWAEAVALTMPVSVTHRCRVPLM